MFSVREVGYHWLYATWNFALAAYNDSGTEILMPMTPLKPSMPVQMEFWSERSVRRSPAANADVSENFNMGQVRLSSRTR